ncbi:MAG: hypothetical protein ACLUHE_14975 [Christensenellales bacterium]
MYCPINTGNEEKTKLFVDMLLDFNLNAAERNQWTEDMLAMDYATEHPITKELQADPYWLEASDFYGGQSYRQMVTASFENPSANLEVNLNDAEADSIISSEIEKMGRRLSGHGSHDLGHRGTAAHSVESPITISPARAVPRCGTSSRIPPERMVFS